MKLNEMFKKISSIFLFERKKPKQTSLFSVIEKHVTGLNFLDALKQELIKLGTENPNFIYNPGGKGSCYYDGPARLQLGNVIVGPECKGCIIGQALQNMGWNDDYEFNAAFNVSWLLRGSGITSFIKDEDSNSFNEYMLLLRRVQASQDDGKSWGESIKPLLDV